MNRFAHALTLVLVAAPSILCAQSSIEPAVALYKAKKFAEAEQLLAPIAKNENEHHAAWYYLGLVILERDEKRAKEATSWLEKAVKLQPNNSDYNLWLGRAYGTQAQHASVLRQPGLAGKTKDAFERAAQLDPNNIEAHLSLIDYYSMAPGIMGGSKDKAKQEVEIVRRLNAYRGAMAMVELFTEEKNWAGVERELKQLQRAYPDSTAVAINLIAAYLNQQQFDSAFELVDAKLASSPNDMLYVYQVGRLAALSGKQLERGEQSLKRYLQYTPIENEPRLAFAHYRLGGVYEKLGKKELAREEYQIALKEMPDLEELKNALKRVK